MNKHTLEHALNGLNCTCEGPTNCVICGKRKRLASPEQHFDTCSSRCFQTLLRLQRECRPKSPTCPNCGQWQRQGDCLNECTRHGFV